MPSQNITTNACNNSQKTWSKQKWSTTPAECIFDCIISDHIALTSN